MREELRPKMYSERQLNKYKTFLYFFTHTQNSIEGKFRNLQALAVLMASLLSLWASIPITHF